VVAANVGFGLMVAERPSDWLPLGASCLGTLALFLLQGIPMRLLMFCGTGLWIANNLIVGSIGGTALELVVAAVNATTIWRLWRQGRAQPGQAPDLSPEFAVARAAPAEPATPASPERTSRSE
jgi:hypothetical protein